MRVGFVTASASRQAGGLFWAVRSLASHILAADCEIRVFSADDAYSDDDRSKWGEVPVHTCRRIGPAAFGYMPDLGARLGAEGLDLVHTHGLWMYPSVAARGWGRQNGKPWLVSPHGMLDPWALRNAPLKKRLARVLYEDRHLRGAGCLHALCDAEAAAFRALGLRNPIAVIPNGVDVREIPGGTSSPDWMRNLPDGSKILLFLGRIHPKKGLSNLLRAWAQTKRDRPVESACWQLVIAGWEQNGHQSELQQLTETKTGLLATGKLSAPPIAI